MKLIEVITDQQNLKSITGIAKQHSSEINWVGPPDEQDRQLIRLLVGDKDRQLVLDALQSFLGQSSRILVIPLEVVLPRIEPETTKKTKTKK